MSATIFPKNIPPLSTKARTCNCSLHSHSCFILYWMVWGLCVFSQSWNAQMLLYIDTVVLLFHLTTKHEKNRGNSPLWSNIQKNKPNVDTGKGLTNTGRSGKSTSCIIKHLWWETETSYLMMSEVKHTVLETKNGCVKQRKAKTPSLPETVTT